MVETGSITFGGLASGLDTKTLITQLVGLARQPVQRLEQTRTREEKKISAFKEFNSKLLALKTAAKKLGTSSDFFARTSAVSDDTKLNASTSSTAQTGSYAIAVNNLAKVGQETFVGVADQTALNLTGTFTLQNATTNLTPFSLSVNSNGMSLEQLRDAINNHANNAGKVNATILDTGTGTNRYRLVIKGNNTGTLNDFDVTSSASLTKDSDVSTTFAANDAIFTVDGVILTRSNNTVSDVMNGVTLTLKDKTTSSITVTINNDTASIQNNIKSFITTYNDVRAYVDSKSIVDQKNPQNNGLFLGDWTTRGITSRLQQLMTGTVTGLTDGYNALNDLGITTDKDGKLSIDDTKLSTNLSANSDSISKIFIGVNGVSGLSSMVDVEIDHLISPVGGLIDIRMDGLQERVTGLNDRITVMERRLTSYESTLVRQFSSLERLVGALQMQSNSLGSLRV